MDAVFAINPQLHIPIYQQLADKIRAAPDARLEGKDAVLLPREHEKYCTDAQVREPDRLGREKKRIGCSCEMGGGSLLYLQQRILRAQEENPYNQEGIADGRCLLLRAAGYRYCHAPSKKRVILSGASQMRSRRLAPAGAVQASNRAQRGS